MSVTGAEHKRDTNKNVHGQMADVACGLPTLKKLSRNWTLMFAFTYSYSRFVLSELSPHYSHSVIKPARVQLLVSCIITDIVRVTHFLYRIIIIVFNKYEKLRHSGFSR